MTRNRILAAAAAVLVAIGIGAVAIPAAAEPGGAPELNDPPTASTEATIVRMDNTSGLYGGFVDGVSATTPYPSTGLRDQHSVTTAEIILDDPLTPGPQEISTYCIDLKTETTVGVHYDLGTWNAANVPNLPYVQWILQNYYPTVPSAPAGTDAEKVRAVQGAIWYFTDQFVVNRFYPTERNAVRAIVEAAQAAVDPTPTPPPLPTLTITPASIDGAVPGEVVGPFAVGGDVASATIDIPGNTPVYRDAAGTIPVSDGETVIPGDQLWARYDPTTSGQGFSLTAMATLDSGTVFLYNGGNPPRTTAQKLVLAANTTVPIRASASITPQAAGTLQVDVTVAGAAAGNQGQIDLTANCVATGGWTLAQPLHIPARTPAGTVHLTIPAVPATATCDVTEQDDGSNPYADLTSSDITPASVTIASGATSTISVVNTYAIPVPATGSLQVDATILGAAAGQQSALELVATCTLGSDELTRTLTVPAGATGTTTAGTIGSLPAGATCEVTQTVDGRNANAELTSSDITPASVTIASSATSTITVTDTYAVPVPVTGDLAVTVTIAGDAAGQQSEIGLLATCTLDADTTTQPIAVPAGLTGTSTVATLAIPVDSSCAVTQTASGANDRATLSASTIVPASVVIRDGVTVTVAVTDTYVAAVPTPTPTPTPTPSASTLPATGSSGTFPWPLAAGILALGLALLALDHVRRLRRARR
jgi:TQXA domain-containing protein